MDDATFQAIVTHTRLMMKNIGTEDASFGHPPDTIYLQQFDPAVSDWEKGLLGGESIRTWVVSSEKVKEVTPGSLDHGAKVGMYYERGWLGFAVSEGGDQVLVGWQLALATVVDT